MQHRYIHLNGNLREAEASGGISPFDRGFLYGDGLFETMRVHHSVVYLLERHLQRLRESAEFIGIELPSNADITARIDELLQANGTTDCVVRLTVTRGVGGLVSDMNASEPTILLFCRELPSAIPETGARAIILDTLFQPPRLGRRIKSIDYLPSILALQQVHHADAIEGFYLNQAGEFVEGTVSNLFFVVDGELRTAPLSYGILPGITRGRVIELARECGIVVVEAAVSQKLLDGRITECFFTNAARGIVPVTSIDGVVLVGAQGGGITPRLMGLGGDGMI
jgi:branched-subunit amino acid aminotransferase/4-amino-4-deoxychorismate lyase